MVNAKIAYDLITKSSLTARHVSALIRIWKCNIPLKLICFIWLCLENRINTWDNLIRRGWVGPNRCCLCRNEEESVNHLLCSCPFAKDVWKQAFSCWSYSVHLLEDIPNLLSNWLTLYPFSIARRYLLKQCWMTIPKFTL